MSIIVFYIYVTLEADERDRLQEGGRNPRIMEDSIYFDFTTERIPRRVSSRGDAKYYNDAAGK